MNDSEPVVKPQSWKGFDDFGILVPTLEIIFDLYYGLKELRTLWKISGLLPVAPDCLRGAPSTLRQCRHYNLLSIAIPLFWSCFFSTGTIQTVLD